MRLCIVNGWSAPASLWQPLKHAWPGDTRVVDVSQSLTQQALLQQVAAACTDAAICLGWSLGGMVLMRLATSGQIAPKALITYGASPTFLARADWPHGVNQSAWQAFQQRFSDSIPGCLRHFDGLQSQGSPSPRALMKQWRQARAEQSLRSEGLRVGLDCLSQWDDRARWPTPLPYPVEHWFGETDALVPVAAATAVETLCPDRVIRRFSAQGHVPIAGGPERLVQALHSLEVDHG